MSEPENHIADADKMVILHLTLHRKWFDMIASGEKREECRKIKPYWTKRLEGRHYDAVKFVNGYGADRPWMLVEVKRIAQAIGRSDWGAPPEPVYMIALGRIFGSNNAEVSALWD